MTPFFSVIIPLYNKEKHILSTLQSVLNQSFDDFEIIVVDDGSTDDSYKLVESIKDTRLQLLKTKNKGVSHARNYGIKKAKGDLIAFLDADDLWKKNHLEKLKILYIELPNCGMYAMGYDRKINNKVIKSRFAITPKNFKGVLRNFFEASMVNGIASSSSIIIPKHVFETVGMFNECYTSGEDTDLWIRIALKFNVAFNSYVSVVLNWDAEDRVSSKEIRSLQHFDIDFFNSSEQKNKFLKAYLDRNRLSLAYQYKLSGNVNSSKVILNKIAKDNIKWYQKALFILPNSSLIWLFKLRSYLRQFGIDLRLFR